MDKAFIHKVEQTVLKHIEDELFGVSELASEIGFSKSQLLRKIKAVTGKTASEFIREIRLQEAAKLILKKNYTASEISYRVGFNSPSYFCKCFHDHFGVTPGEYKDKNQEEISFQENPKETKSKKNIIIGSIIVILLVILSFFFIYRFIQKKQANKPYSIAVLPVKNNSNDKTNQYFADGIMDDILNHLSTIKDFRVISRTTMEQYRKTNKTIPKIAKELKVNYIIESSIQKYKDSVMIFVQLIDAKKDKHVWSKRFKKEFKNIFALESEIATQIATELKITLSPTEIQQIETKPTDNIEAYTLYLRGRFFWHQRTEKDLNNSIYYFNKALELDSSYALAYSGLADTYFIMAWWGFIPKNIGFDKGKEFAQKALSINNNLGEAHATLGGIITWQEWNWKEAEKELKYAITLNPRNATIHQYYCELLNILGRNIEAREQINLALELNPYSVIMNRVSSFIYYNNFEFQKAIKGYQTTLDLADGNNIIIKNAKLSIICSYLNLDKNKEAIDQIKKFISIDPSYDDHELLDKIYNKSGIKGVVYWFIDWLLESKERKYRSKVTIAKLYSCIGDYQNTLKYLESASENKEMGIPGINNISDFKPIKNEPRFQAILKKMNLTD